jgi:hypothetical protein
MIPYFMKFCLQDLVIPSLERYGEERMRLEEGR